MARNFIARGQNRYTEIKPGTVYESMVTNIVEKNLGSLFPLYFGKKLEPYFRTAAGDVKPDLIIIKRDFSGWALVEVETPNDSFSAHILPQLSKLKFARSDEIIFNYIRNSFADINNLDLLEKSLKQIPEVYLVMHGSSESHKESLKTLGVNVIDIEIYTNPPSDYILKVFDKSEEFINLGVVAKRSPNPLTRNIWILPDFSRVINEKLDKSLLIEFNGESSTWGASSTNEGHLLRQPDGLESLKNVNSVSVLRHKDNQVLRFIDNTFHNERS
jgi:hypothetical protein